MQNLIPDNLAEIIYRVEFSILAFIIPMIPAVTRTATHHLATNLMNGTFKAVDHENTIRFDMRYLGAIVLEE